MRALTVIFSFQSANPKRGFKSSRMLLYFQFSDRICEIASTTWLYSGHSSPEEHRGNDVEKECHNKGDASDHECALNKAIKAFAGDLENYSIDDSSDDCANQALP